MAHADVAERIHDALAGENAVCSDELFEQVVQLGHRSPHTLPLTYMLVRNGVNFVSLNPGSSDWPSLLNFSSRPLKHMVSFARGQAMAENPVPVCAAADLPPGNVKSFQVGDELVAVYNIDGTFYATEAQCTHASADLADGISAPSTCRAARPCKRPAASISRRSAPR